MKSFFSDILLLGVTIIWGISFPLIRNAIAYIPDSTYIFLRFIIATLVLCPIVLIRRNHIHFKTVIHGFILGLALFSVMYFTVNALYYTSAINVAFLTGISVIMVPFIWTIYTKVIPEKLQIISAMISLVGIFLLSGGVNFNFNFGDCLGLLIALSSALQIILTSTFSHNEDPFTLGFLQILFCMILSTIYWSINKFPMVTFNRSILIAILITGILSTALAFTIQTIAQKYTTPTKTAIIFSAEPVFGAIFSTIIAKNNGSHEVIVVTQALGCLLIFLAMILAEKDIIISIKNIFLNKSRLKQ